MAKVIEMPVEGVDSGGAINHALEGVYFNQILLSDEDQRVLCIEG